MLGPKGLTVAAEGCSPLQELENAARRVAIFLVLLITARIADINIINTLLKIFHNITTLLQSVYIITT